MWWILDRFQNDLDRMDEKWGENIAAMTKVTENLNSVSIRVQELNKLLTVDNGKPSVVTQLREVTTDVKEIKTLIHGLKDDLVAVKTQTGAKTPKEVQIERLKTLAAIAGMLALIIPGILSFLHQFM
jgi:chromosome segregation ATPase